MKYLEQYLDLQRKRSIDRFDDDSPKFQTNSIIIVQQTHRIHNTIQKSHFKTDLSTNLFGWL